MMSNLTVYGFALLFLFCPITLVAAKGANGIGEVEAATNVRDEGDESNKPLHVPPHLEHHPHLFPSYVTSTANKQFYPEIDEAREYVIQIAVKFSDGGDILMNRPYKINNKEYNYYDVVPIETLLKDVNGIEGVKYVEIDEKNEEVKKLSLKEKVKKGAKLVFEKPFNEKILVSAEEKDGGEDKDEAGKVKEFDSFKIVFDKDGHDHAGPGHHVDIKTVVQELAKVDWRWHISRDDDDEKDHVFQSLFDAHVMVALSERVITVQQLNSETGKEKEKLEEVARFHFNSQGLNLFKKRVKNGAKDGVNFIVNDDEAMTEERKEFYVQRNRGLYNKFEFPERLLTRQMTIQKMKKIALAVIDKRKWGGPFRCHHFVYNFVRSIVPEGSLQHLKHIAAWPTNMRVMDEHYRDNLDGTFAFDECVKFSFKDLMKVKAGKAGQSGTSENYAGKGDGKEHDHHVRGQVHHYVGDKEGKKPIKPRHPQNG